MAILFIFVRVYFCMVVLRESSSAICEGELRLTRPKMAAMMNGTYPECRGIDFRYELSICEVGEADVGDWPTCVSSAERLPPLKRTCPDGSWNRTCYPVPTDDVMYAFSCTCHSAGHIWNTADVRDTYWSDLEAVNLPVDGLLYTRRLMMVGGECIAQEFIKTQLVAVIKGYNLPDSVYTVSSSIHVSFSPHKARLNGMYDNACGWVAGVLYNPWQWLGITLPDKYVIRGCVLVKCNHEHLTMVTVSISDDDIIWRDVVAREDISTRYNSDGAAHIWFSTRLTSRYWKIFTVSGYGSRPRVKADLFGFRP